MERRVRGDRCVEEGDENADLARGDGWPWSRHLSLDRRRLWRRPTDDGTGAAPDEQELRRRHHHGEAEQGPEDHHRHQVRPARLRPQGPRRQAGRLRRGDRQDHRRASSASRRQDRVRSRPRRPSARRCIEQGKVDIVVATYTINDKRKERIDFAGPYYVAGQHIMVRTDDTSITGPDSFKDGDQEGLLGDRARPRPPTSRSTSRTRSPSWCSSTSTSKCVDALKRQAGRRRHHRQRHPARLRRQERGHVQARRRASSPRSRTASA